MWRTDSLEKTLMLGKIEGRRRRGWQRMKWLGGVTDLIDMSLSKLWELVLDREAWHATVHGVGHDWVTELTDCNSCPITMVRGLMWGFCYISSKSTLKTRWTDHLGVVCELRWPNVSKIKASTPFSSSSFSLYLNKSKKWEHTVA